MCRIVTRIWNDTRVTSGNDYLTNALRSKTLVPDDSKLVQFEK